MNATLETFARTFLKGIVLKLPSGHQDTFIRMYGKRGQDIHEVIDNIPVEKLNWVMTQVENSFKSQT